MGLAEWFSTFCSNVQVQDGGTISSRYKTITRRDEGEINRSGNAAQ